ncbi:MAG: transcriptional repressor [Arcobacteraceae bacterium]|jgi:Fur family ferric uptake transcriptional regulator|nr:transcriptional repressor [Arcobacteraceae bacterium]MDY0327606.1 transcriptional repressor [Arcobacteraceae bacterium]
MQNLFNNTNIKPTTARIKLLEILKNSQKPLSYEDIKDFISMDKATFYRNITLFEQEELINSFESNDKKRYFELTSNPHAHFVCKVCHKIECMDFLNINIPNYKIDNITISGICKNCL